MFTLENSARQQDQSMALRRSPAVCTSNESLNKLFSFPFLSFVRWANENGKFSTFDATTFSSSHRREKETNESASFCLYSSYSRRTNDHTRICVFLFLSSNDRINRHWTSNIVSLFISTRPVRFLASIFAVSDERRREKNDTYILFQFKQKTSTEIWKSISSQHDKNA